MLELVNVELVYSRLILALKGVSLEVPDGAIVALLGANGAGKTTTIKSLRRSVLDDRRKILLIGHGMRT